MPVQPSRTPSLHVVSLDVIAGLKILPVSPAISDHGTV